jgi:hypothetical protein
MSGLAAYYSTLKPSLASHTSLHLHIKVLTLRIYALCCIHASGATHPITHTFGARVPRTGPDVYRHNLFCRVGVERHRSHCQTNAEQGGEFSSLQHLRVVPGRYPLILFLSSCTIVPAFYYFLVKDWGVYWIYRRAAQSYEWGATFHEIDASCI